MDNKENNDIEEKPVIIIDDDADDVSEQGEGEIPVIVIERTDDDDAGNDVTPVVKQKRRLPWMIATAVVTVLVCVIVVLGYKYYVSYAYIGVPVSVTSEQNIAKLERPVVKSEKPGVILTTDTILGVTLNMYELQGLKAEITFDEPDSTDTDVYLYSQSMDYSSYDPEENEYLGSLVLNGKEITSNLCRLGYCAMANDNIVIGIAKDDDVKDYCVKKGGSFFRQFILVSNGTLPYKFYLHGKVERRGIGRMGDKLYYLETQNRETMWDFADAIREYGFIDAIYITGGASYSFYRSPDGELHDIGVREEGDRKGQGIIPWVVFKKRS